VYSRSSLRGNPSSNAEEIIKTCNKGFGRVELTNDPQPGQSSLIDDNLISILFDILRRH
jgi:hypothetical protein